jgi:Flp pilus assembly secretin CpaC
MHLRNQFLPLTGLLLGALSPASAWAEDATKTPWMDVEVGQSVIFRQDRSIGRVLISDDKVAELKLLDQDQFQVRGLEVGSTDLWVWYRDDMAHPANFELTVHRDLSGLVRRLDQITAGQAPKVYPLVDRIAVDGPVNSVQTL